MNIPYVDLSKQYLKESKPLLKKIHAVLKTGNYVGGDEVIRFEKKISILDYLNKKIEHHHYMYKINKYLMKGHNQKELFYYFKKYFDTILSKKKTISTYLEKDFKKKIIKKIKAEIKILMLICRYRDLSYYNKQLYYLKFHGGFYLDSFLKKKI